MNQHLSGLPAWLVQRLSALYMAFFTLLLMVSWFINTPPNYAKWLGFFSHPLSGVAAMLFFIALLLHIWVGVRDVILDYLGGWPWLRLLSLTLLGGWLIALGLWVARVLITVMLR
jgi:succinate dehydrogenase / fumarate reductase membrane anchor subunit